MSTSSQDSCQAKRGRCRRCRQLWSAMATTTEALQEQLPHAEEELAAIRRLKAIIGSTSVQHRLLYNRRSFESMSPDTRLSYNRLGTVFELNWTFLEPIAACVPKTNPLLARADVTSRSLPFRQIAAWCSKATCRAISENVTDKIVPNPPGVFRCHQEGSQERNLAAFSQKPELKLGCIAAESAKINKVDGANESAGLIPLNKQIITISQQKRFKSPVANIRSPRCVFDSAVRQIPLRKARAHPMESVVKAVYEGLSSRDLFPQVDSRKGLLFAKSASGDATLRFMANDDSSTVAADTYRLRTIGTTASQTSQRSDSSMALSLGSKNTDDQSTTRSTLPKAEVNKPCVVSCLRRFESGLRPSSSYDSTDPTLDGLPEILHEKTILKSSNRQFVANPKPTRLKDCGLNSAENLSHTTDASALTVSQVSTAITTAIPTTTSSPRSSRSADDCPPKHSKYPPTKCTDPAYFGYLISPFELISRRCVIPAQLIGSAKQKRSTTFSLTNSCDVSKTASKPNVHDVSAFCLLKDFSNWLFESQVQRSPSQTKESSGARLTSSDIVKPTSKHRARCDSYAPICASGPPTYKTPNGTEESVATGWREKSSRSPLAHFVKFQLARLKLPELSLPTEVFILFLKTSLESRFFLRTAVTHRRELLHNVGYQELMASDHIKEDLNSSFYRLIKSLTDIHPLLIETRPLKGLLRNEQEDFYHERNSPIPLSPCPKQCPRCTAPGRQSDSLQSDGAPRIALIVFLGGKDMVSLDWLPFISRFLNYSIASKARALKTAPRGPSKGLANSRKRKCNLESIRQAITPLIPTPRWLLEYLTKTTRNKQVCDINDNLSSSAEAIEEPCRCPACCAEVVDNKEGLDYALTEIPGLIIGDSIRCEVRTAFLLPEYPGNGASCGPPSADSFVECSKETLIRTISALKKRFPGYIIDVRILGYSLGAAVGLRLAAKVANDIVAVAKHDNSVQKTFSEYETVAKKEELEWSSISSETVDNQEMHATTVFETDLVLSRVVFSRLILVAPFTSVTDWVTAYLRIPGRLKKIAENILTAAVQPAVNWDNRATLTQLCRVLQEYQSLFADFRLSIFHGARDMTVPVEMGLQLAKVAQDILVESSLKTAEFSYAEGTARETKEDPFRNPSNCGRRRKKLPTVEMFEWNDADHQTILLNSLPQIKIFTELTTAQMIQVFSHAPEVG